MLYWRVCTFTQIFYKIKYKLTLGNLADTYGLSTVCENGNIMQDRLVSRNRECDELQRCLESDRSEFVIISGRRRIGKTYLIDKFFRSCLKFLLRKFETCF